MLVETLINHSIPFLRPTDTVGQALELMQEYKVEQLIYVENDVAKSIFHEDTLLNWHDDKIDLGDLPLENEVISAHLYQHIYELVALSIQQSLQVLPIIDEAGKYAGCVLVSDLLLQFAKSIGCDELGAVVVLRMTPQNYSLAEISRLVESNNAKIISCFFANNSLGIDDSLLTLKLNRTDVSAVVATLERFGYHVEGVFGGSVSENIDQHRLNLLLRYLET